MNSMRKATFRYISYCRLHIKGSWPEIQLRSIFIRCGIWLRSFSCANHHISCRVRNLIDNGVFWTFSWQRSGTSVTADHISKAADHRYHCGVYVLDNQRCNLLAAVLPLNKIAKFSIELWLYFTGVATCFNEMQPMATLQRCVCVCFYYPNNMQVQTATFQTNGLRSARLYVHNT